MYKESKIVTRCEVSEIPEKIEKLLNDYVKGDKLKDISVKEDGKKYKITIKFIETGWVV